jgi:hypothetical protein
MSSTADLDESFSGTTGSSPGSARRGFGARAWRDGPLWLVLVAVAFTLLEFTPSLLKLPLGADEITYIAQTSAHASGVILPPVHSRGPALLAAPVTLLSTSAVALRIWLALLSGAGLLLALFTWHRLRPDWVIAIAGLILASLGIAQLSGVQAMPDWWVALGSLAMTGLFLQAVTGRMRARTVLPLLALAAFFLVLQRLQDAAFLVAPLIIAMVVVPAWRKLGVVAAIFTGVAAGLLEWAGESYGVFGGVLSRLHMMKQEPPKFGFYFTLPYQLRVLNGPWYCPPGQCTGWDYPWLTVWWAALVVFAVLGILALRRTMPGLVLVPTAAALSLLLAYTLFVPYAAPRYLLPVIALLTLPAADGIAWLVTAGRWRTLAIATAAVFLVSGAASQHLVRTAQTYDQTSVRKGFMEKAAVARAAGVRPPCIEASTSVAYYLGCSAPWTGQHVRDVVKQAPGGISGWHRVHGLPTYVLIRN